MKTRFLILTLASVFITQSQIVRAEDVQDVSHEESVFVQVNYAYSLAGSSSWNDAATGSDKFVAVGSPEIENMNSSGVGIGYNFTNFNGLLAYEISSGAKYKTGQITTQGGSVYTSKSVPLDIKSLMLEIEYPFKNYNSTELFGSLGVGISNIDVGRQTYMASGSSTVAGLSNSQSNGSYRMGVGALYPISERVKIRFGFHYTDYGKVHTKTIASEEKFSFRIRSTNVHLGLRWSL